MPRKAVIEEVVKERHAGLLPKPVLLEDTIRLGAAAGPRLAPPVELPPVEHVGLAHSGQGRRPKPAADVVGLEPSEGIFIIIFENIFHIVKMIAGHFIYFFILFFMEKFLVQFFGSQYCQSFF